MIYIGADHKGFQLKGELYQNLAGRGYQITDMGADSEEPIDYPDIAKRVAIRVIEDPNNRGILICSTGAGMCIAANKIRGARAAQAWDSEIAKACRNDDNINILCLSSDRTSFEQASEIVKKFLDTSFGGAERFNRRIQKIIDLENENK